MNVEQKANGESCVFPGIMLNFDNADKERVELKTFRARRIVAGEKKQEGVQ